MIVNLVISRVNPIRSPPIGKINDHARIMKYEDIAIKRFIVEQSEFYCAYSSKY